MSGLFCILCTLHVVTAFGAVLCQCSSCLLCFVLWLIAVLCQCSLSKRKIIHNMFTTLTCSVYSTLIDEQLVCNMLSIARAIIYVDQSEGGKLKTNLDNFLCNKELGKDECIHNKLWTQWKLAELGMFLSASSLSVSLLHSTVGVPLVCQVASSVVSHMFVNNFLNSLLSTAICPCASY